MCLVTLQSFQIIHSDVVHQSNAGKRKNQDGNTEDANTPKALAAKQMSEEMRVILGQRNLIVTGNQIYNSGDEGIAASSSSYVTIANNVIDCVRNGAIDISGVNTNSLIVTGNVIKDIARASSGVFSRIDAFGRFASGAGFGLAGVSVNLTSSPAVTQMLIANNSLTFSSLPPYIDNTPNQATFTGTISGNTTLTINSLTSGTVAIGQTLFYPLQTTPIATITAGSGTSWTITYVATNVGPVSMSSGGAVRSKTLGIYTVQSTSNSAVAQITGSVTGNYLYADVTNLPSFDVNVASHRFYTQATSNGFPAASQDVFVNGANSFRLIAFFGDGSLCYIKKLTGTIPASTTFTGTISGKTINSAAAPQLTWQNTVDTGNYDITTLYGDH